MTQTHGNSLRRFLDLDLHRLLEDTTPSNPPTKYPWVTGDVRQGAAHGVCSPSRSSRASTQSLTPQSHRSNITMCHAVSKSTAVCLVVMMATVGLVGLVRGQPQPNYDPPQPSSEFGTPEATAKIAEKAGFLDVVGVKLGMSPKDAVAAAKAHNAALAFDPKAKLEYEALPGVAMLPVLASTQNAKTSAEGGSENMGLLVPYRRNEAFGYGV